METLALIGFLVVTGGLCIGFGSIVEENELNKYFPEMATTYTEEVWKEEREIRKAA